MKRPTTISPILEERPAIQTRPVGDWNDIELQVGEPSEGTKDNMRSIYRRQTGEVDRNGIPW